MLQNAMIKETHLAPEGHGIMTARLSLDFGGSRQVFGGEYLRAGSLLARFVENTLRVVGVNSWEDLPGELVRVDADLERVHGIINILDDDRTFYPAKDLTDVQSTSR